MNGSPCKFFRFEGFETRGSSYHWCCLSWGGGGYLKGFDATWGAGTALVSHLVFADHTLVFSDVVETQLDYIGQVLSWFQVV